ncbi:MAG: PEP-CTERM sorting domain-containing protein [Burkholderiaceae bacterium]
MRTVLATAALLVSATAHSAIVIDFTPSSQHVNIGSFVTVDMTISGLGAEILRSFDLDVIWSGASIGATTLSYDGAVPGASLDQLGHAYGADPQYLISLDLGDMSAKATAQLGDGVIAAHQADDFLIARLGFSADANGATTLTLGPDLNSQRKFLGLGGAMLDVTVGSACIAVGTGVCAATVPEPASWGLAVLAGFAGLVATRRRRGAGPGLA